MENYLWQKTLLDMYRTFDRVVIMVDNKFNRLVSNSLHNNNTTLVYEELISFMTRKNNCLMAKTLVDEALRKLKTDGKNVLSYYYKDKISFKQIAEKENINIRQVFRNYEKELASFAYFLTQDGFNSDEIEREFGHDQIFLNSYIRLFKKINSKGQMSVQLPGVYVDDNTKIATAQGYHSKNFANTDSYIRLD